MDPIAYIKKNKFLVIFIIALIIILYVYYDNKQSTENLVDLSSNYIVMHGIADQAVIDQALIDQAAA